MHRVGLGPLCLVSSLTFATCAAFPADARAQGNDLSAPTGGRTTLMGNTGVALARDGAAPFLNPAAIVRIQDQRLAFSVNFYSLGFTHYGSFHQPGAVDTSRFGDQPLGGTSITSNSFRVLPSTLCLFFTVGDLEKLVDEHAKVVEERVPRKKLAICFASLESEDESLDAVSFHGSNAAGPTTQVQSLSRRWSRTFLGPTYSAYISKNVALGASLEAVYTHNAFGFNANSLSAVTGGGSLTSALGTSGDGFSLAATALVGVTYHKNDWTFGAAVRPPSIHLFSSYSSTFNEANNAAVGGDSVITSGSGSLHADPPMRFAVGVGRELPKLHWELDAAIDVPTANALTASLDTITSRAAGMNALTQTTGHETDVIRQRVSVSPSAGAEYFIRPDFSVLGGISANLTGLSAIDAQQSLGNLAQARRSDILLSGGVGSYGNGTELLFGTQLDFGWGQELAANPYVVPNNWAVVNTQSYRAMLVVAGATDLRTIERAVDSVKNAVQTGDPDKKAKP